MAEALPQIDDSERRLRLALSLTAVLWRSWTPESVAARLRRETPDFAEQLCCALMTPDAVVAAMRANQGLANEVFTRLTNEALGVELAAELPAAELLEGLLRSAHALPSAVPIAPKPHCPFCAAGDPRPTCPDGDALVREASSAPHPMFASSRFEIHWIQIIRYPRSPRDGSTAEWCPKLWRAEDLRSWQQVGALYGGGEYRATALDIDRGVVARFPEDPEEYVVFKGARLSMTELGRRYVSPKKLAARKGATKMTPRAAAATKARKRAR